jgi:hypothetical protein
MAETSIADTLRAYPDLSYDEAWGQACEAGVPLKDFDQAWVKVRGTQKVGEHDRRVQGVIEEIRKLGEETKTREEWKAYFKAKGYLDDECDMGYVLNYSKVDYGVFSPKVTIPLLSFLSLVSILGVMWLAWQVKEAALQPDLSSYELRQTVRGGFTITQYAMLVPIFFVGCLLAYLASLNRQFKGCSWKVMEADFSAKMVVGSMWKFDEWRKQGAQFFGVEDAGIGELFGMTYDNRETCFGTYETYHYFEYGGNKTEPPTFKKIKKPYFLIAQKTRQKYPWTHCVNRSMSSVSLGKDVRLEGVDFNRQYHVSADRPEDAFYVLNPRVMAALLDPLVCASLITFETVEDWIFLVFNPLPIDTGMHFGGPVVRYADYQRVKFLLLHHLDLATNINDVLSREIVDDGSKRSKAKIV